MKKYFIGFLVVVLLACALAINYYYWTTTELEELRHLPPFLLTSLIIYIGVQLLKRYLKKKIEWYDWMYYVGLVSSVLPLLTFFSSGDWLFQVTRYGALFFLFSPLVEVIKMILQRKRSKSKQSNENERSS